VLGIFWDRANKQGALAGMLMGTAVAIYYIVRVEFDSIPWLAISGFQMAPWFHVQSTSAGVFGVASGFLAILIVSLLTPPSGEKSFDFLERIRRTPTRKQQ
jgi:cation/acetate symporter